MRSFVAALQFLTRLPCGSIATGERDRARAPYWFGAAGLLLGAVLAGLERGLRLHLALFPRMALVLAVNAALTGGLHLDGLADTFDGLGGRTAESSLAIMRDSRIGVYGVLALLAVLALQSAALSNMGPSALSASLLLAPGWGRASQVLSAAYSRAARPVGLGAQFIAGLRPAHAWVAVTTVLAAALALAGCGAAAWAPTLVSAGCALAAAPLCMAWFRRRFGGQTGDTMGAVNELTETVTYWIFMGVR